MIFPFNNPIIKILVLLLFVSSGLTGQRSSVFYSLSSLYDDSPEEWIMEVVDSSGYNIDANLRIKWLFKNVFDEWVIDYGQNYYSIRKRWPGLPIQWELSGSGSFLTIRQKWRGDPNIWLIEHNGKSYIWRTYSTNNFEEWFLKLDDDSVFEIWTRFEFDIRDWDINDKAADLSPLVKIAALFTTVYLTIPKN